MKYLGSFEASERTLADGRVIVPGEPFDLSKDDLKDPHNQRLLDEGQIVEAKGSKSTTEGG